MPLNSGTLPDAWGKPGSFSKLTELNLNHTNITSATQLRILHCLSIGCMHLFLAPCLPAITLLDTYTQCFDKSQEINMIALCVHLSEPPAMIN